MNSKMGVWHDYNCNSICDICGERKGGKETDHTECSEIRREAYKDSNETKHPIKKFSKARRRKVETYFSRFARLTDR